MDRGQGDLDLGEETLRRSPRRPAHHSTAPARPRGRRRPQTRTAARLQEIAERLAESGSALLGPRGPERLAERQCNARAGAVERRADEAGADEQTLFRRCLPPPRPRLAEEETARRRSRPVTGRGTFWNCSSTDRWSRRPARAPSFPRLRRCGSSCTEAESARTAGVARRHAPGVRVSPRQAMHGLASGAEVAHEGVC